MKARRCADFSGKGKKKHCIRFKKVDVSTAIGKRVGLSFYHGDRIKKDGWSKKRWERAKSMDRARIGMKYEYWERFKRMRWK